MDAWTQALFARPPLMLGRRLRPFSLSHALLLRATGNPYAYVGAPATVRDLFAAVAICSRGHAENAEAYRRGVRPSVLAAWRRQWRRVEFAVADASFREYIAAHTRRNVRAQVERQGGDTPDISGPVEYYLHRHLTEDRGWPDEAAWDCAYGYAWALLDCSQEWRAPGTLQSEYDARVEALLASEAAARARGDTAAADAIDAEIRETVRKHK